MTDRSAAAGPALHGLRARLAMLDARGEPDGDALIGAARPLIEDDGWVRDIVATAVRRVCGDPCTDLPFRALDHDKQLGLVLFDDRRLRISAQRVPLERIAAHKTADRGGRSVGFTGAATVQRVVRAGGAVLDLWEAPPAGAGFSAGTAGRCRRAGTIALADGAIFAIDGRRQAWTIARMTGDMLLLQATARHRDAPLAIEYDAATGAFLSASATDGAAARMQLMATLLRHMGRRDAAPAIAHCAADGAFFLRWHLLRELAALEPDAAAPLLRAMTRDAHPELRDAAARTLRAIAA